MGVLRRVSASQRHHSLHEGLSGGRHETIFVALQAMLNL